MSDPTTSRRHERAPSRPPIDADGYRARSRRSFLFGGAGAAAAYLGWRTIQDSAAVDNIPAPLRAQLERNEALWTTVDPDAGRVQTYALDEARPLRVNGTRGLLETVEAGRWRLTVEGPDGDVLDELALDDITALGEEDLVVLHKCIEGWSNVTHWTGVRFARFAAPYLERIGRPRYVSMTTIDGGYYVGVDLDAALHPQVLLGTGLGGQPLNAAHGAPLRLVSPIHYGVKSIKQLGTIRFTDERPADFWTERGYDWHSQH